MMTSVTERQIITIDGPAASGKSSVARGVADALELPFVSSGLLYRAATYLALRENINPGDEEAVLELLKKHDIELIAIPIEPNRVSCDDQDISAALHTDDVDANVSALAVLPGLRHWINDRLREVKGSFVVEGRDMGAVVFPEASHKFYLTASAAVRAQRRVSEREADLASIEAALKNRDEKDKKQLAPASDAKQICTDKLSLDEVIQALLREIKVTA
ncbi:MAG: (d)CMP kinase [Trueperaceae bacterium]|nr:(d)CMP kinase [Trueperaceae bacterium]